MSKSFFQLKIFKVLGNKYLLVLVLFLSWIIFFDENSIVSHMKSKQQLDELIQQKQYYQERIASDEEKFNDLNQGIKELEKFAREQYYMSKPDEDVFVVIEEE